MTLTAPTPLPFPSRRTPERLLQESMRDVAVIIDRDLLSSQGLELLVEQVSGRAVRVRITAADGVSERAGHRELVGRLTTEEVRLWRLVAEGLDALQIARTVMVSERTAKRRVAALLRKLQVPGRVQAAALAGRCGVLDMDE